MFSRCICRAPTIRGSDVSNGCFLWALCLLRREFTVPDAEFAVVVRPSLGTWSELHPDYVVLKTLDTNSIRVISSVLGQSVALDSYARCFQDPECSRFQHAHI